MTEASPLSPDDFLAFFHAVHGHDPFPWQARLAGQVVRHGWPSLLDLPTGSGKTAAIDVAVFHLALTAGQSVVRTAPLRIVYVVDRRTIVDQAFERGERIRRALAKSTNGVLLRVRTQLEMFSGEQLPLRTALLRGGIARDDAWARTPDQPLIAVSTVDQVGSRILFRGYGLDDLATPIHAGLLGNDVLYLLDEVHLSQPFKETLRAIGGRYRKWADIPTSLPFTVVEMSATPGGGHSEPFCLDDEDRADPTLSRRLNTSKLTALVSTPPKGFLKEISKHVIGMLKRPGATIAVVVNRVNSAREIHRQLRESVPDVRVELLTGRMRPFDRDTTERGLLARIRAGRERRPDDRPVVVVATQAIEAGADFDFDGIVTECASLDALRQRFGRVDRLGDLSGTSRSVIVARTDSFEDDPVYGNAVGKTWEWLGRLAVDDKIDFGLSALEVPSDAADRGLLSPQAHAPVLLPIHLDAWVQTSPMPEHDPDVALWLHGPKRAAADVQIVWRSDLRPALLEAASVGGAEATVAEETAIGIVEAIAPVSAEAMSVPFVAAKRWLEGREEPDTFDVEGAAELEIDKKEDRNSAPPRAAVLWLGDKSRVIKASQLRPGQTIVIPSTYGGIAHGNWAPASVDPVPDVAELAASGQGRRPVLRLHPAVTAVLLDAAAAPTPNDDEEDARDNRDVVAAWLRGASHRDERIEPLLGALRQEAKTISIERYEDPTSDSAVSYFVLTGRRRRSSDASGSGGDGDSSLDSATSSFTSVTVTLSDHLRAVSTLAKNFAERLALPDDQIADLALAATWHDTGKADPRFQRWLHGGSEFKALVQPEPLAKSRTRLAGPTAMRLARERAGYPAGGRHELTSISLMDAAGASLSTQAHDWDRVRHLVASHHGYCRPLAPWVPDADPVEVVFKSDGVECRATSAHTLARLDSGVAERFWITVRRYGWWGSALFEAILRLADHRQSEREQQEARPV